MFNYPPMQSAFNNGYPSAVPYVRPYQQPAQPPMDMMHMQTTGIIKVNGRAGADTFQLNAPNAMVALFDANEDKFYLKITDGAGYPTVETYRFTRENDTAPAAAPDFITRSEYDSFKTEIMEGIKNVQQFVFKDKSASSAAAEPK